PGLRRLDDADALPVGDRPGGVVERRARLDLDEDQEAAAARDDVDLADRAAPAPRNDAEALGDEQHRGPALGRDSGLECDLPLGAGRLLRTLLRRRAAPADRRLEGRGARAFLSHRLAP